MDSGPDRSELTRSYEGTSLSDLDKGFYTDQSISLSVVSSDGLLKPSKGVVLEYLDPNSTVLSRLNYSINILSPLVAVSKNILSPGNTLNTDLSSPVEGKSSTPYERVKFQKPMSADSLDLSCVDLTTTHPSWEVSFVKPVMESPKSCLESSWSPINPSAPPDVSMIWSGTSPHQHVSEELQRSWKEMVKSGQVPTMSELRDEQQSYSNLAI
ncbi:uncharacterized protein si:ch73-303b9.1 [Triplophysa dalaica]|uniref:uncharacterized protein si:ch73-303b9.1 n=1 Tax=Triplophysa dalaica TaxID=1582913 RepID=UPI0024DFEAC4|nr:uncharacterized protein si:ch73-303b9.1 [Triplophysa dalaica]